MPPRVASRAAAAASFLRFRDPRSDDRRSRGTGCGASPAGVRTRPGVAPPAGCERRQPGGRPPAWRRMPARLARRPRTLSQRHPIEREGRSPTPKPANGEQLENLANDHGGERQRSRGQREHMIGLDRGGLGGAQIGHGLDRPYHRHVLPWARLRRLIGIDIARQCRLVLDCSDRCRNTKPRHGSSRHRLVRADDRFDGWLSVGCGAGFAAGRCLGDAAWLALSPCGPRYQQRRLFARSLR